MTVFLDTFAGCKARLEQGLLSLESFFKTLKKDEAQIRIRRDVACVSAASTLDDGTFTYKIRRVVDDLDDGIKIKSKIPLTQSTSRFNLKHVLDDVEFDRPLTLDRKTLLANKRR